MLTEHLEKLVHFVGIVRSGSIRKYAVSRNLSQPGMSRCLQLLESELQTTLLVRGRAGVQLTQAGVELLDWSEKLINEAEKIGNSLRSSAGRKFSGRLKMGTYQSIAVYFLPHFYQFLRQEQRNLSLSFFTGSSADLVLQLEAGTVDFIISVDPPKAANLHQVVLYADVYSLFKPINDSAVNDPVDLFCSLTARDSKGQSLKSSLKKAGLFDQAVACSDFESVKAMLEAGIGWAILPDRVAAPLLESKKIERVKAVPTLQFFGKHSIVFSCRVHRANDDALKWIETQLRRMLGT